MVTISAPDRRLTLLERAERNADHAAIAARRRDEAARARAERFEALRHNVFRDVNRGSRYVDEPDAARALIMAHKSADSRAVLRILQVAIDNQWHDVFRAGIRHFRDSATALHLREIWQHEHGPITDRTAV